MSVHHMCALPMKDRREGIRSHGTGVVRTHVSTGNGTSQRAESAL